MKRMFCLMVVFAMTSFCFGVSNASAWKVLNQDNDGKLKIAYIQCDNGKTFPLHSWVKPHGDHRWVYSSSTAASMGSGRNIANIVGNYKCSTSEKHWQLGVMASYFCGCIGSS